MSVPPELTTLADWVARRVGDDAKVRTMTPLRREAPRWVVDVDARGSRVQVVLKAAHPDEREELETEAAALELAKAHGLLTPRLMGADVSGEDAGRPAILMSFIDGTDRIPVTASYDRLRAIGAAAAAFHQIPLSPTEKLPLRTRPMPWIDFSAERRRGEQPSTAAVTPKTSRTGTSSPQPTTRPT